jgi:small subunit ribosomal protein S17
MSDEETNNETNGAEGSASDEAQAARGESEADAEPAVNTAQAARGESEADAEPAVNTAQAARGESEGDAEPAGSTTPSPRAKRKTRDGVVVSNKMDQTAVVAIIERVRHPKYNKFVNRTKKLYAHDKDNDVNIGDKVRVAETRPMSKTKRWRIVEVVERAK